MQRVMKYWLGCTPFEQGNLNITKGRVRRECGVFGDRPLHDSWRKAIVATAVCSAQLRLPNTSAC